MTSIFTLTYGGGREEERELKHKQIYMNKQLNTYTTWKENILNN